MRRQHILSLRILRDSRPGYIGQLLCLKSWELYIGCRLHDVHNGLALGTGRYCGGTEMVDELYIVIESLRNGYQLLQCHVLTFPTSVLTFDYHTYDRDDLHAFWSALDVLSKLCDMLADRGVMWYGGKLHVFSAYKSDSGLLHFCIVPA